MGAIESALVAVVQQQERAYQLQDLDCAKCKNVGTTQTGQSDPVFVHCSVLYQGCSNFEL